jgi:spermidine/putrescine transport system substrate-binding protein
MQASYAADNIVNVYTWSEEIPRSLILQFEKETGIKVNYSTFDSNEVMYAKLRTTRNPGYDIVEPSSYYIDRMRRQNMLAQLDKSKLSNFKNLDPTFLNQAYDPGSLYSIPFIWGTTGVFLNKTYFEGNSIQNWSNLLNKKYLNQLMFLDDAREVFSMALCMLGYSINDTNPEHIKQAYLQLKALMPNVRLFNSDAAISIMIDEDATIGMVWNGNLFKAKLENPQLQFIYPQDGFEIWVDSFALLKDAPHPENAYKFLNFLLRPDVAKIISLNINYSTANLAAKNLMPLEVKNNPALYPPAEVLRHGEFEIDIGDQTFALLEKYWEQLKIGG